VGLKTVIESNLLYVVKNVIVSDHAVICIAVVKTVYTFRKSCFWKSLMRAMNLLCDD